MSKRERLPRRTAPGRRSCLRWLCAYIVLIVVLSTYPFVIRPRDPEEISRWIDGLWSADTLAIPSIPDFLQNIVLFMPFGFLAGCVTGPSRERSAATAKGIAVVACAVVLGASLETAQFFLRWRITAGSDVVAAAIGCAAGIGCYRFWSRGATEAS